MSTIEQSKRPKKVSYEVSDSAVSKAVPASRREYPESAEEGNLEKVRDILFGTQSREFEERCNLLEKRLLQESSNLKEQLTRSLEDVKTYINTEVSRLTSQIQQEQAGRSNSEEKVSQVIQTLGSQLESQLSGLSDQTTTQHQELEGRLTQQKIELTEQQQQAVEEIQNQFQQSVKELKADKTDRAVLADMLMDVALKLKVGQKEIETS